MDSLVGQRGITRQPAYKEVLHNAIRECKRIEFTVDELVYGDGHFTNLSDERENQKLKLYVTDIKGKKYKIKTKCTLKEYKTVIEYYRENE